MKLPDTNLLFYAINERSPGHERARSWLEATLSGTEAIGFAWISLLGFTRISTNPTVLERPLSATEAMDYVDEWLDQPVASIVHPTRQHAAVLRRLLEPIGTAGNLTSDAHLAALAIEHGAELCSHDADFSRFPGVRWTDPLR
ncbi:MAG TPA: type II toxin-antitoxin system VapC family toxin [Solirubrobacterales bacterium]|nr:type II toxin-antitoxin system VapC family toxin [Solirubrobacterales bacterium]